MSKRTIVVFDTGSKLFYTELSDLPFVPMPGVVVRLAGARYQVTVPEIDPAVFEEHVKTVPGQPPAFKKRSGNEKLLELVSATHSEPRKIQKLIQEMESIGSCDQPEIKGGIILVPDDKKKTIEFDDLVYLHLKLISKPQVNLAQTVAEVRGLLAAPGKRAAGRRSRSVVPAPIKVTGKRRRSRTAVLPAIKLTDDAAE